MKFILNIGMHKTGSSSIQQSFSKFSNSKFAYLDIGHPNHSPVLMTLFLDSPADHPAHRKNNRSREDVDVLREKFSERFVDFCRKHNGKTIIASAEDIGSLNLSEMQKMQEWLGGIFDSFTMVGYARPPASFMSSAFQQRLAGGMINIDPVNLYPGYRRRFEKFDVVFGKENVIWTKFDRECLLGGDVVLDFASKCGLEFPVELVKRDNEGRPLEAIAVLYLLRSISGKPERYPGSPRDNAAMVARIRGIGSTPVKLHSDFIGSILQDNAEDLEWMSKRLGKPFTDAPSTADTAIRSLEQLREIGRHYLPEIAEILAREATENRGNLASEELVAQTMKLLQDFIRIARETKASKQDQ